MRLALALTSLLCTALARAQPDVGLQVALAPSTCATTDDGDLLRSLALELRSTGVSEVVLAATPVVDALSGEAAPAALAVQQSGADATDAQRVRSADIADQPNRTIRLAISYSCATPFADVELRVRAGGGAEQPFHFDLSDVPVALRVRTLALSMAEVVRPYAATMAAQTAPPAPTDTAAPPSEVKPSTVAEAPPAASVATAPAAAQQPTRSAAPSIAHGQPQQLSPEWRWALTAGPLARVLWTHQDWLAGAELSVRQQRFAFGLQLLFGRSSDALGSARYGVTQPFVAFDVLEAWSGAYGVTLSARAALGLARGAAEPAQGASAALVRSLAWDVAARSTFIWAADDRWALSALVEVGRAGGPRFTADERTLALLSGGFAAASLAVLFVIR